MGSNVKIPFAEKNGKIVDINEVENGLACNCYCRYCKAQLIAKNNELNVREAHFAHYNSVDCGTSVETWIHDAAKQFLAQTKKIVLPDILHYDKSSEITFEKVELEKSIPFEKSIIKVDALGHLNNIHKIIIEFVVTHSSSEKKKQIFKKLKIPTIEVSLNRMCVSFDDIENVLLENGHKEWLYYSLQAKPEIVSIVKKYLDEISALRSTIDLLKNENLSEISGLKSTIDSLSNENLLLKNEKLSLEEKVENCIVENVKLMRKMKGYKA